MPCSVKNRRAPSCRQLCSGAGRNGRGFTLIEMVAVIIIAGIIFSFGSALLGNVFSGYALKRDATDADWQAKVALERMARELRAVRSATTADLAFPSNSEIRFVDTDGNNVCFYLNAGQLRRAENTPAQACGTTGMQVLADNIASLNFRYWDNAGTEVLPPATPVSVTTVYYITMSLTVTEGSYSAPFRTNVRPRNF
jgi:prepilin-type N-terminal cleavage/methylation domain-containing protein